MSTLHPHPAGPDDFMRQVIVFDHPGDGEIIGSLHMPFAPGQSPHTLTVAADNRAWLLEMGLFERGSPSDRALECADFHGLAGLVHHGETRAQLLLVTNFISALFFFDDIVDAGPAQVGLRPEPIQRCAELMMAAVESGRGPSRALPAASWDLPAPHRRKLAAIARALADVTRRLRAETAPGALRHYIREMGEYFQGVVDESLTRHGQAFSSRAAYERARTKFSAMYACVEFAAVLRGLDLSPGSRSFIPYRRMVRSTNLYVSYVNDLFSYKKEHAQGEVSNLVMVLERAEGRSRSEAFAEACRICDQLIHGYIEDRAQCRDLDLQAHAGIELLEQWMRGNYDWYSSQTKRYVEAISTHC